MDEARLNKAAYIGLVTVSTYVGSAAVPVNLVTVPVGEGEGEGEGEGAGEGEGEGETRNLCEVLEVVRSEFVGFRTEFVIANDDFFRDGVPEEFALALLSVVCSRPEGDSLEGATLNAFDINRMALDSEE